ncbi:MAG TPA: glycosyltransferase family 4 protein, partial [Rugosimonospora sp.]|nr:glycosyltransferase family 4 protein [Rugosimonospora sp.]
HLVVPDGVDDPARPSGGNVYDRRLCSGLRELGWRVDEHPVAGPWPEPDGAARTGLARVLAGLPDGAPVLVDGLVASPAPDVLVPHAQRLRLAVLVHMPLEDPAGRERDVLRAARAVVTTSEWTRRRLLSRYALAPGEVHAAPPGVDPAEPAAGSAGGGRLLCVGAVSPHKGHDVLLAALARNAHLDWRLTCAGTLDRDPGFVARLRERAHADGIADRVSFTGPLAGVELAYAYADADLLVLASRAETYGMVVTEALARAVPVVATAVGGLPDTLGRVSDRTRPGMLVRRADPAGLGRALCAWLTDPDLRKRLRTAASERRGTLSGWELTVERAAEVLGRI